MRTTTHHKVFAGRLNARGTRTRLPRRAGGAWPARRRRETLERRRRISRAALAARTSNAHDAGRLTCRRRGWVGASLSAIIAGASEQRRSQTRVVRYTQIDPRDRPCRIHPAGEVCPACPVPRTHFGHHLPYTTPPPPYYHPRAPTSTSPVSDCTVPCHVMVHPEYAYSSALLWADLP